MNGAYAKKVLTIRLLLLLLLSLSVLSCEQAASGAVEHITILHTNDMHAQVSPTRDGQGGAANIAGYVQSVQQAQENVLLLDAGDMTQGTPISTKFQGRPIFEIMNAMGYQAALLGNHEFDNGYELIQEFRDIADFPLLSANASVEGKLLADSAYILLDVGKIKIAILGLTTDQATPDEVHFATPDEPLKTLLPELKKQCDLILLLTHLGVEEDLRLARTFPEVDIIVGGHDHYALHHKNEVAGATIVQAGSKSLQIGRIDLSIEIDTGEIISLKTQQVDIPAPGINADAATLEVVKKWEAKVAAEVDIKIGDNPAKQSIDDMGRHIARIWHETFQTDFALQNVGGTRAPLPKGDILIRNIIESMPFDNTLTILHLDLRQVEEQVEQPEFKEYKRFYTVLTNSYMAKHLITRYKLPPDRVQQLDIPWRKPVLDYIRKHGTIMPVQDAR